MFDVVISPRKEAKKVEPCKMYAYTLLNYKAGGHGTDLRIVSLGATASMKGKIRTHHERMT